MTVSRLVSNKLEVREIKTVMEIQTKGKLTIQMIDQAKFVEILYENYSSRHDNHIFFFWRI